MSSIAETLNGTKWLEADAYEWKHRFDPEHTTLEEVIGGLDAIPRGTKVYPIKRVCKIKDDSTYKLRYCVLGNLDDYGRDTYGLKDAAKVFKDELVEHLINGGYVQSKWDQYFFIKWTSISSFIYIIFNVKAPGSNTTAAWTAARWTVLNPTGGQGASAQYPHRTGADKEG